MPPKRVTRRGSGSNNSENPDIAEIIAQQLAALVPNLVTQVTNAIANNSNTNDGNNGSGPTNNEGNGNGGDNNNGNGGNNGCTYKEFMTCKPKEFDGKGGALAYTRWVEKMEAVIDISNCADSQRVKYVTSSLTCKALTWWNTQIQARGRAAAIGMTWEELKTLMTKEFCPNNEMQRLENEFWNHTMVGAGHAAYTDRFHELAKLIPHLVTPESKRIERYIYGLVPQIRGTVAATDPPTIQSAILKAGTLTDEMVRNGSLTRNNEKRKEPGEASKQDGARQDNKKTRNGKGYVAANSGKGGYAGTSPLCTKCNLHHSTAKPCPACYNCKRVGHRAKECKTVITQAVPISAVNPMGTHGACYECGSTDHYRNVCPRWNGAHGRVAYNPNLFPAIGGNNQNQGNDDNPARGRAFVLGANCNTQHL